MSNPIYNQMKGAGNQGGLLQRFMQFKNGFSGNAQQQVQNLLNSGRITQDQYNKAVQQAKELQKMLGY